MLIHNGAKRIKGMKRNMKKGMKTFIVDIGNCLELSHNETFFYKYMDEGSISLFKDSISSLQELGKIEKWLKSEINRNPFSIDEGLVVFYIPRNLTGKLSAYYYDNIIRIYIHQLVVTKLDDRFKYVCVMLDQSDENENNDYVYKTIESKTTGICSDDPILKGKMPAFETKNSQTPDAIKNQLDTIDDDVLREFYEGLLQQEIVAANGKKENLRNIGNAFASSGNDIIGNVRLLSIAHYHGDIAQKTKAIIKLICYVCEYTKDDKPDDFESRVSSFAKKQNFDQYMPDYDKIRQKIADYRFRLSGWLVQHHKAPVYKDANVDEAKYLATNKAEEFKSEIENITLGIIEDRIFNPSFRDIVNSNIADEIFDKLDAILENAHKKLHSFCKEIIDGVFQTHSLYPRFKLTEKENLTPEEKELETEILNRLNLYTVNELPGYPAEVRLRQELEDINQKIQYFAERVKVYKKSAFVGTLVVSLLSVFLLYFGAQNSVFVKENTWWVFFFYNAVAGACFSLSYFLLRSYYKHQVRKLLAIAKKKVSKFLENFRKRAEEFENNVNTEMELYCKKYKHDKLSVDRNSSHTKIEKFNWHKLKIRSIMTNLMFYDGFIAGTEPKASEQEISDKALLSGDAEHSYFYHIDLIE